MDIRYDPKDFIKKLTEVIKNGSLPVCPYCGGTNFTTTEDYASIIIQKDFDSMKLGNTIPMGIVICQKCGHVEFFALGGLGLMPKKGDNDGNN